MNDYVIITDTSADIPADILDKGQIRLIPMVYQLNGEECPHRDLPISTGIREAGTARLFMISFAQAELEVLPRFLRLRIPITLSHF